MVDVTDIQFKLHDKFQIFEIASINRSKINLLAAASGFGLLFVGSPTENLLKVLRLENLIDSKENDAKITARTVQLPAPPNNIAVSCDSKLLAIDYTHNGIPILSIYEVSSFLTEKIILKLNIRLSVDDKINAIQILWNPSITSTVAVVLSNNSVSVYNIKDQGYEFHTLDKSQGAQCACWSPKGKQIVIGFFGGKLAQYKPDLKLAKTIILPPNSISVNSHILNVQWLSTYQFALAILSCENDSTPSIYIFNAPKNASNSLKSYGDICYSSSGPRESQIYFSHITPWNILLVASANSVEVGVLGTNETNETPNWQQYIISDEARIELPLTKDKQETFPMGFAFDTGTNHQLTIDENKIPVMPVVHVLSTHGLLLTFNFLNLKQNAPGLCSPPQLLTDNLWTNFFKEINFSYYEKSNTIKSDVNSPTNETFFPPTGSTSTPAPIKKTTSLFTPEIKNLVNSTPNQVFTNFLTAPSQTSNRTSKTSAFSNFFNTQSQAMIATSNSQSKLPNLVTQTSSTIKFCEKLSPTNVIKTNQVPSSSSSTFTFKKPSDGEKSSEIKSFPTITTNQNLGLKTDQKKLSREKSGTENLALFIVPPTYTPPENSAQIIEDVIDVEEKIKNDPEINEIINRIVKCELDWFNEEISDTKKEYEETQIQIQKFMESIYTKRNLNKLTELCSQANESLESLSSDVRVLRHGLVEMWTIIKDIENKRTAIENPESSSSQHLSNLSTSDERLCDKYEKRLADVQMQIDILQNKVDAQWQNHLQSTKNIKTLNMTTPKYEGIFLIIKNQSKIMECLQNKINQLHMRMTKSNLTIHKSEKEELNISSLTDKLSTISVSNIPKSIEQKLFAISDVKNKKLVNYFKNFKVMHTKPFRLNSSHSNSEIILPPFTSDKEKRRISLKSKTEVDVSSEGESMEKNSPKTQNSGYEASGFSLISNITPSKSHISSSKVNNIWGNIPRTIAAQVPQSKIESKTTNFETNNSTASTINSTIFNFNPSQKISFPAFNKINSITAPSEIPVLSSNITSSLTTHSNQTKSINENKQTITPLTKSPDSFIQTELPTTIFSNQTNLIGQNKQTNVFGETLSQSSNLFSGQFKLNLSSQKENVQEEQSSTTKDISNQISSNKENQESTIRSKSNERSLNIENKQPFSDAKLKLALSNISDGAPEAKPIANIIQPVETVISTKQTTSVNTTLPAFSFDVNKNTNPTFTFALSKPITIPPAITSSANNVQVTTISTTITAFSSSTTSFPATTLSTSSSTSPAQMFNFADFNLTLKPAITQSDQLLTTPTPKTTITTSTTGNLFANLNICKPTTLENSSGQTNVSSPSASIFSTTSFDNKKSPCESSLFEKPVPKTPDWNTITTTASVISGNLFSSIPKPDQSVFGVNNSNITTVAPSIFSGTQPTFSSSGNLFGSSPTSPTGFEQQATTTVSIFSGSNQTSTVFSQSNNIFGNPNNNQSGNLFNTASTNLFNTQKTGATDNIFATKNIPNQNTSGGSLFSGSGFGNNSSSTGSIFGGQTATPSNDFTITAFNQQPPISFDNTLQNTSIFGGSQQPTFGQSSFGSTNFQQFSFASFAQGGPSISQTGFGNSSGGSFSKPTFGSNSTFGASPTFGGAASFGNFSSPNQQSAFTSSPTQKSNLFESLGSSETSLSFGNLAQNANNTTNIPKDQFGGKSFSSWR